MSVQPTKEERDANLDALTKAVDEWVTKEETRLSNESKFLKAVAQGRGAQSAGSTNLRKASALVQTEIDAFLGV